MIPFYFLLCSERCEFNLIAKVMHAHPSPHLFS